MGVFSLLLEGDTATHFRLLDNQPIWLTCHSMPSFSRWLLSGAGGINSECLSVVPQRRRHNLSSTVPCLGEPRILGRRTSVAPSLTPCWRASNQWSRGVTLGKPARIWVASLPSPVGESRPLSSSAPRSSSRNYPPSHQTVSVVDSLYAY